MNKLEKNHNYYDQSIITVDTMEHSIRHHNESINLKKTNIDNINTELSCIKDSSFIVQNYISKQRQHNKSKNDI